MRYLTILLPEDLSQIDGRCVTQAVEADNEDEAAAQVLRGCPSGIVLVIEAASHTHAFRAVTRPTVERA